MGAGLHASPVQGMGFPTHMRAGLHPAINGISTGRTGLGPWHQTAINASNVSANLGYKFGFGVQFGQYVCTSSVQLGFEVMQTVLSVMCTRMSSDGSYYLVLGFAVHHRNGSTVQFVRSWLATHGQRYLGSSRIGSYVRSSPYMLAIVLSVRFMAGKSTVGFR